MHLAGQAGELFSARTFVSSSLFGKQVNCSEVFTPVITDSGVCCAFNLQDDLRESTYSQLVKEMQVKTGKKHLFKSLQTNAGATKKASEIKSISPGADRGLEVIIDRNFDR